MRDCEVEGDLSSSHVKCTPFSKQPSKLGNFLFVTQANWSKMIVTLKQHESRVITDFSVGLGVGLTQEWVSVLSQNHNCYCRYA
jgi:hypothetical protein